MEVFISAHYRRCDFPAQLEIEHKITIFEDRVHNWQINAAIAMGDREIPHRGPAMLQVLMSYFEMIGKYKSGLCGAQSLDYFREGLMDVFPQMTQWETDKVNDWARAIYGRVRCGLYHVGLLGVNTGICDLLRHPLVLTEDGVVWVSPPMLAGVLSHHFREYVKALRDTGNATLRANFEKRYDLDNGCNPSAASDCHP